jgi:hypothetical protein
MSRDASSPPRWRDNDVAALEALALDGPDPATLPWSGWAMRPAAIELVAEEIGRGRGSAVELGAGVSTVLLARAARREGGSMVSIEHDPAWAAEVRELLRRERLDDVAKVVEAPLRALPTSFCPPRVPGFEIPATWYDVDAVRSACREPIELLVVDGPPGGHAPAVLVRAPAAEVLADLLSADCTVVLDDISRPAERHAAEQWRRRLRCELEPHDDREIAVLRRSGAR